MVLIVYIAQINYDIIIKFVIVSFIFFSSTVLPIMWPWSQAAYGAVYEQRQTPDLLGQYVQQGG